MKEISKIIEEMMEDTRRLIDESKIAIDGQNAWRDNFFARANNIQDSTLKLLFNAIATQNGDDGLLYSKLRRTVRLVEMNMILTDALNRAIEKIEKEFPEQMKDIKNELSNEVEDKLEPIHIKFLEEKKQDEEINKAAKEREKTLVICLDSINYMKLAVFQELKEALQVKRVNDELLEYLSSSLNWLLHYSHKYQIPLPEKDTIIGMLENIMNVNKKLPPNFKHPNGTPREETEPNFKLPVN